MTNYLALYRTLNAKERAVTDSANSANNPLIRPNGTNGTNGTSMETERSAPCMSIKLRKWVAACQLRANVFDCVRLRLQVA